MLGKILRLLVTIVGGIIGYCLGSIVFILAASTYSKGTEFAYPAVEIAVPIVSAVLWAVLAYALEPRFRGNWNKVGTKLEKDIQRVPLGEMVGSVMGLIAGLLIAYLLSSGLFSKIELLSLGTAISVLTYIVLGCFGIVVGNRIGKSKEVSTKQAEDEKKTSLLTSFLGRNKAGKSSFDAVPKVLDTSVLIDGRIFDIMKTGFIEGRIIIPEYVLTELRHLSDSADPMKKIRGRRGLEILKDIQAYYGIQIYNTYSDKDWDGAEEVDVKLLRLAQKLNGKVVTNDYNLIQVAEIQEIPVLNVNDVVKALRPVLIPGEVMSLQIIKEGRENNQGVGYMDDGTMIVVEGGRGLIGREAQVEVTTVLQTASGRMIFAKPKRDRS